MLLNGFVGESGAVGVGGNLETGEEGLLDIIEEERSKSLFGVGELGFEFVVNSSAAKHSFSLTHKQHKKKLKISRYVHQQSCQNTKLEITRAETIIYFVETKAEKRVKKLVTTSSRKIHALKRK